MHEEGNGEYRGCAGVETMNYDNDNDYGSGYGSGGLFL